MRLNWSSLTAAFLMMAAIGLLCAADARSQAVDAIVLSKTQALVKVDCTKGCTVTLANAHVNGKAVPVITEGQPSPRWSLMSFAAGDFQFASKQVYVFEINHAGAGAKTDSVSIDTSPKAAFSAKAAGPRSVNLTSKVAFALPGKFVALANTDGGCPGNAPPHHLDITLTYPGIEATFQKTAMCEIDMSALPALDDPDAVSVVQGEVEMKPSAKTSGPPKPPAQIAGLVSVLGDTYQVPDVPNLNKAKAPATEADAWLWINGTVTAGTGTTPAWVLDGKLVPFPAQFIAANSMGPTVVSWFSTNADIGNNKINGQTAKDVINFIGPSIKNYEDWQTVGAQFSISPTYETNRAFNHKNMLATGDAIWDWGVLNESQLVRTARDHRSDPTKMPKEGDFSHGYAPLGWNLHFHTGFEAGGALAPSTVNNPKSNALIGTLPTYSIARFVPQIDGVLQYRWFGFESDVTGRYLFTTEHTAVNNRAGIPYLETVSGWKAVHVGTFSITPSGQHLAISICYTDGFSAPTYQRANGLKIGLLVKY